ncbi:ABC transporter ATP-binding protein [candidate division TA06 bacterium]|uniref:ABC transporter ATP-binding protein n=1 Tax=candidate division TA06 bacterium TaxID=2250710 RepID=A0A523UTT4_UNCT6|nr:MAG: ABC transporter ATP-binding protein [candidate division TA06 bacterium]
MPVIVTEKITKIYDEHRVPVRALNGVDLGIEPGEFTAIVGPSGSGKTTLMNIIGGLDGPTSGKVFIDEHDITGMRQNALIEFRLNHIGFVFQAFNLIPVLTAKENVEFIMLLQGKPRKERTERAVELLKDVGLSEFIDRRPWELSGGQQQRVAVARALASFPSFVLADEPTANLDSTSAGNLLDIMEEMNRTRNMTFIFSTHDARVVERARRVVTLRDGEVFSDERMSKAE